MAKDRALIQDIESGTYTLERGASGATLTLTPGEIVPTFPRRKFLPPVGLDEFAKNPQIWPGYWVDATGYCQHYAYGWHTGADLNLNHPHWDADRHAPVLSIADGEVYAVRTNVSGWHNVRTSVAVSTQTVPRLPRPNWPAVTTGSPPALATSLWTVSF